MLQLHLIFCFLLYFFYSYLSGKFSVFFLRIIVLLLKYIIVTLLTWILQITMFYHYRLYGSLTCLVPLYVCSFKLKALVLSIFSFLTLCFSSFWFSTCIVTHRVEFLQVTSLISTNYEIVFLNASRFYLCVCVHKST